MKTFVVEHELPNQRIKTEFVGTVEDVLDLVRKYHETSEGTLISVRKLPAFSPTTRA